MPSNAAETTAAGFSRSHTASLEMDKTIDRIRQLSNFERFLLPPTADELMMAAGPHHPVFLINVSPILCDAFLIHNDSSSPGYWKYAQPRAQIRSTAVRPMWPFHSVYR